MSRWQDNLINFIPVLGFIGTCVMLRGILAHDIEKQVGRKLTDWEWQYYLQESYRKAETDFRQQTVRQWRQSLVDRQIIHDFVWNEG